MVKTDVLIIGSGGAGLRAAIAAREEGVDVVLVSKGRFGKSGATITALADIDVDSRSARDILDLPGDPNDSQDIFFNDILSGGKYINNQKILETHVADAPKRLKELVEWGVEVKGLVHNPGHQYPRGVLTSGRGIMRSLVRQAMNRQVKVIEDMFTVDLLVRDGIAIGAVGLDLRKGDFMSISAKATIIATGGGMMTYQRQTAPEELTGDGQAMAYRAGAELIDMEMIQFHPCSLILPPAYRGIGFPFTIGTGSGLEAWLLNKHGQRFMSKWDPERMEGSTRDKLSIGIMTEILEGRGTTSGGVYLSFAHLPNNLIDDSLEWLSKRGMVGSNWKYQGFQFNDLMERVKKGYAMEVSPASHFFMGGIRINEECETSVPGFFAVGEVAGGTHGANRISGNALTQVLVQGAKGGEQAAKYAKSVRNEEINRPQAKNIERRVLRYLKNRFEERPFEFRNELQAMAWEKTGVIRDGKGLKTCIDWLKEFENYGLPRLSTKSKERQYNKEWIEAIQLENMATILKAIATSAFLRKESRGAHYRKDYEEMEESWVLNIVLKKVNGEMHSFKRPIVSTRWK